MKINRFEELDCWREARTLAKMVYKTINSCVEFKKDFRLTNQITAAAISVMSNIAEGFSRQSNKEFIQFLFISKSSAAEVQSILYAALDQKYIAAKDFEEIYNQADRISKMNSGLIKYLKKNITQ